MVVVLLLRVQARFVPDSFPLVAVDEAVAPQIAAREGEQELTDADKNTGLEGLERTSRGPARQGVNGGCPACLG
jgi:hypothetical protein